MIDACGTWLFGTTIIPSFVARAWHVLCGLTQPLRLVCCAVLCCVRVRRSQSASLRSHDGVTRSSPCSAAGFASDLLACLRPRHDRSPYYVLDVTIRCRPMVVTREPRVQLPPCRPQAAVHHSTRARHPNVRVVLTAVHGCACHTVCLHLLAVGVAGQPISAASQHVAPPATSAPKPQPRPGQTSFVMLCVWCTVVVRLREQCGHHHGRRGHGRSLSPRQRTQPRRPPLLTMRSARRVTCRLCLLVPWSPIRPLRWLLQRRSSRQPFLCPALATTTAATTNMTTATMIPAAIAPWHCSYGSQWGHQQRRRRQQRWHHRHPHRAHACHCPSLSHRPTEKRTRATLGAVPAGSGWCRRCSRCRPGRGVCEAQRRCT